MDRDELHARISQLSMSVQHVEDWFSDHSMDLSDMQDMITLALNSEPNDIDFDKEFICEYPVDENRFRGAYGWAIMCLTADELAALIESGDIN